MTIHPTADVKSENIGEGTTIWQYAVILPGALIGKNCNINCHTFIENDVIIGDSVTVKSGVYLWDGIRIQDDVFIGPNVTFVNDKYPKSKQYPDSFQSIHINKGASIGANATILGGITIGEYAMIGAGSVVTKDVLPFSVVYGNPAKPTGTIDKKGVVTEKFKTND
jgi:acetyltransferase-like isoleucine patch superfamily enzyme